MRRCASDASRHAEIQKRWRDLALCVLADAFSL